MFKPFFVILFIFGILIFPMRTAGEITPQNYWENFVMARGGLGEEIGGILPVLVDGAYYEANRGLVSESTESLAYLMPETREINVSASFYNLPQIERCDCVSFIKEYYPEFKGIKLFYPEYVWEHFQDYGLEKTEAQIGVLIILKNHIAVVSKDLGSEIEIVEKNQIPCKTGRRIIPKDYEKIIGFLK